MRTRPLSLPTEMEFAKHVRDRVAAAGIGLGALLERAGLDRGFIRTLERSNGKSPTLRSMRAILDALTAMEREANARLKVSAMRPRSGRDSRRRRTAPRPAIPAPVTVG